jgi:hypothetical protein
MSLPTRLDRKERVMTMNRSLVALAVVALAAIVAVGLAQQDPAPAETQTLSTASYSLHPVDDSGVTGHLQIVERAEGGTRLILTLMGIAEGRSYPAALYVGSCGPDRPVHLELEPVARENDPYVGITESDFSFADLTEGDYFVYVFDGDTIDRPESEGLDVPALACGEVGLGAVEGQP